ncbi:MAG: hypothetical protein C4583_03025 [Anaerolineaceae bacterium]|nr:MAG: hypothetical protein C4583_03025 [Anaerolineaceae bacterium]
MKVKFLKMIRGGFGSFERDEVADIDPQIASELQKADAVEIFAESEIETTSVKPPEAAIKPVGKPRRLGR